VEGVSELTPVEHEVVGDRIEAGTFLMACGIAGGEVEVIGSRLEHLDLVVMKLGEMGVKVSPTSRGLWARSDGHLQAVDVATLPFPGFGTDFMPLVATLLAVAHGTSIITENVFDGRFGFVDELARLGADILTEGRHAVVRGVPTLSGAPVRALDVRAGAALVLAGLVAEGETVVFDPYHVDRGYVDLAGKLASLGADVRRTDD
jgi:UDP-N-acetylglucosamine 1-carboxyvinyltransferase